MCHDNIKRFLLYCSYAFGLPILLGLIVFILNHFDFIHEDFNNQIGKETCIVASNDIENQTLLQFIYIYLPIIITISINIVFYSITAYKIYCVQRDTAFKGSESKRHSRNNLDQTRWQNDWTLWNLFEIIFVDFSSTFVSLSSWAFLGSLRFFLGILQTTLFYTHSASSIVCKVSLSLFSLYGNQRSKNYYPESKSSKMHSDFSIINSSPNIVSVPTVETQERIPLTERIKLKLIRCH